MASKQEPLNILVGDGIHLQIERTLETSYREQRNFNTRYGLRKGLLDPLDDAIRLQLNNQLSDTFGEDSQ